MLKTRSFGIQVPRRLGHVPGNMGVDLIFFVILLGLDGARLTQLIQLILLLPVLLTHALRRCGRHFPMQSVSSILRVMGHGLLAFGSNFLQLVSVQQTQISRSFLSRLVVAKSLLLMISAIMLTPVPPTRVRKRLTTGRLINLLTSFAQPTT
jgi:hypothetical protein